MSFTESKKIVSNRSKILWNNEYRQINGAWYPNRILAVFIGFAFVLIAWSASIGLIGDKISNDELNFKLANPYINYLAKLLEPVSTIIIVITLVSILTLLLPKKNLAIWELRGYRMLFLLGLMTLISGTPLGLGYIIGNAGTMYAFLQMIFILLFAIYSFQSWYLSKIRFKDNSEFDAGIFYKVLFKIFGSRGKEKKRNKISILKFLLFEVIIAIIGFIQMISTYPSYKIKNLGICFGVSCLYLLMIEVLVSAMNVYLTWYYVKKYPKEYRIHYKISDRVWYLSEKRAAKHPHVYPPVDEQHIDQKKQK